MSRRKLEAARQELQQATDASKGGGREPVASIDEALGDMLEADDDPKLDRLNEMEAELSKLAADAEPEASDRLEKAQEQIAAYREDAHKNR